MTSIPLVTCPACCRTLPAHSLPTHDCSLPRLDEWARPPRRRARLAGQWRRRIIVDALLAALVWSTNAWPLVLIVAVLLWTRCGGGQLTEN